MAMHKTNSLVKYIAIPTIIIASVWIVLGNTQDKKPKADGSAAINQATIKNMATHDSAAESLDTLTAELSDTKKQIADVSKTNEALKKQNSDLMTKLESQQDENKSTLVSELNNLKNQMQTLSHKNDEYALNHANGAEPITTVMDVSSKSITKDIHEKGLFKEAGEHFAFKKKQNYEEKNKAIPFYTIPANATSVKDRLMTALVGRIPVKGVVTDPYPFKIVISDDNLAANGLRIPHLLQMIVSGYCEGDLNLKSVRGWVTSLTFVFDDGTISTTTSNDNDIGNFTKANSLGYLSDKFGNPFIRGSLITNAPAYLGGNIALGMGVGAANAYAQSQTTTTTSFLGNNNTAVTGSPGKFVAGQALAGGATDAQQWWHDREQQSFDAIYVPPVNEKGQYVEIAVNFAKEIHIDYNPKGRKLSYAHGRSHIRTHLD